MVTTNEPDSTEIFVAQQILKGVVPYRGELRDLRAVETRGFLCVEI